MNKTVSIIVPTHNRWPSLKRLLEVAGKQTYPLQLLEVMVVADGCTDETIANLKEYKSAYKLCYFEQAGMGAATARNKGATSAKGEILIFLDDDIEPSTGLVAAHVARHENENKVVIGYLPMTLPKKAGLQEINHASWWENKYAVMKNPSYRYNFSDLLSGNFSISATLFNSINKFDCSFNCREDYELGARLINAGADFIFCEKAWGYHHDETTNLTRSFKRKRAEGKADIRFVKQHPDLIEKLPLAKYHAASFLSKNRFLWFIFFAPYVGDKIVGILASLLKIYERYKQRHLWRRLSTKLHEYWYVRGMADEIKSKKELHQFIHKKTKSIKDHRALKIDLKTGLMLSENKIDEYRPRGLQIFYGELPIGRVLPVPGAEKLRGNHLRQILSESFAYNLMYSLITDELIKKNNLQEA